MSKLTDIIRREIDARAGGVQLTPAVVVSVQADFKRADVKLIENGAIIKGMLNQSGNKLTVGQSVKVAFQTLPSAGWIAFTNGEADPIGGGDGIQVASAAIVSTATDFIITQETMIDYSPATKVLYGTAPAFIICQENYAMLASNWTNTQKASCVTNEAYFPDAVHFTCYYVTSGLVRREEQYIYNFVNQRTWATSAKGERLSRKIRKIIYEYPNNDPTESPTLITDTVQNLLPTSGDSFTVKDVGNNTTNLTNYTTDMFMVPRAASINHKNNANALIQPFFPENVDYYCAFYFDTAYENNGWGWIGQNDMTSVVYPFKTRAEQDFSMGVTQRVEPVED